MSCADAALGVPGRVRKTLEGQAADWIARSEEHYVSLSRAYLAEGLDRTPSAEAS